MTTFFDWYRAFNRESDVSTSARAVGNAMATRANSETLKFWMTIREVSDFTGMSARNVIRKIDELDGAEWVVRLRRGRFGKASEYVLAVPHGDTSVTKEGHMVTPVSVHGDTSVTPTTPKLPHVTTPKTTPRPDRAKTRNPYDPRPFHPSLASWAFGFGVQPVFCFGGSFRGSLEGSFGGLCTSSRTPPVRHHVHLIGLWCR